MKEVGSYEAKTKLPALLREVADGTRIVITRSGKPVADLVPHPGSTNDPAEVIRQIREMRLGVKLGDNDLQELIQEGRRFTQLLESLPIHISDPHLKSPWSNAMVVAREHGLSVYDGTYLDLAMREGIPLATRDKALRKAAKKLGIAIH
jgi:prevent-host-death family protein